jgi:hypothetical protein
MHGADRINEAMPDVRNRKRKPPAALSEPIWLAEQSDTSAIWRTVQTEQLTATAIVDLIGRSQPVW